jgi:hypothetical protein
MMKRLLLYVVLTAFFGSVGCGPSDNSLNNDDKRIKALKAKGVPDSSLSPAIVCLYQARETKKKSEWGECRKASKQLRIELAKSEAVYRDNISTLKPSIDSLRSVLTSARNNYSHLELKKFDSLLAIVDSFIRIDWLLQAHTKAQQIVAMIPAFTFDSDRSKELRDRVPGEWICSNVTKSPENKAINAVENKIFTFNKDGSAKFVENKKGQSGPYLKEDWEFVTTGTWDVNGDTVLLFCKRFAAVRQNAERLFVTKDNRPIEWKKEPPGPTYDSLITDGSQDRSVTFTDLNEDFKQSKKF